MVGSLASTRFAGRTHIFSYEAWRGVAEMKTRVLLASKAWGVSFLISLDALRGEDSRLRLRGVIGQTGQTPE
jgi:hypothetical protein